MSDPNPPEQPSFNQPAPSAPPAQSDPTAPMPTGGPATPPGPPGDVPTPAVGSMPPQSTEGMPPPPPPAASPASPASPAPAGVPSSPPSHQRGPSGLSSIPDAGTEGASFFNALFDFSFTNFVTPVLVRFVYMLATVALVLSWLVFLFAAFAQNLASGLTVLILGPVFLIVYLAVIRMSLEFFLSVVRMSIDIHHRLPQA